MVPIMEEFGGCVAEWRVILGKGLEVRHIQCDLYCLNSCKTTSISLVIFLGICDLLSLYVP